jgi:hypothetical protein
MALVQLIQSGKQKSRVGVVLLLVKHFLAKMKV